MKSFFFLSLCLWGPSAQAQPAPPPMVVSTETITAMLGTPLSLDKGPWIIGEILFFSGPRLINNPEWRDKVRGRRGILYTKSDVTIDVDNLKTLNKFDAVEPSVYAIPDSPVPPEFFSIASSTNQVRLVFNVVEKPVSSTGTVVKAAPPAAISGVVLTPTAYRGAGRYGTPGLGLDINAAYFIGRLYGKNKYANTVRKTNYLDRLGVWLLVADGKMQIQSETNLRPAVAVGAQGGYTIRDAPQPSINSSTSFSVPVSQRTTQWLSDAYVVASKKFYGVRGSAGFMQGNMGNFVAHLSEFMSPQALEFYSNKKNQSVRSESVWFVSLLSFPKKDQPLAVELIKFNGAALEPMLINFKLGYFLKLNFDVAVLKYKGGYDVLGTIQFRYNQFPRR